MEPKSAQDRNGSAIEQWRLGQHHCQ